MELNLELEQEVLRVQITLITILNPRDQNGLALDEDELPEPHRSDRQVRNKRLAAEGEKMGAQPYRRDKGASSALNNGVQPFENLKGRHIPSFFVAHMIELGKYHGVYTIITDSQNPKWSQRKIEFRPGSIPSGKGALTEGLDSHLDILLYVLREEVEYLKVAGLWVNPKDGHFEANLVLRAMQEDPDIDIPNPIMRDENGFFVKLTQKQLDEIRPH